MFAQIGNEPDIDNMKMGIYNVNVLWFSTDAIFDVISSMSRLSVSTLGTVSYYKGIADKSSSMYPLNLTMTVLLLIADFIYSYRLLYSFLDLMIWYTRDTSFIDVQFDNFDTFLVNG